MVGCFPGKISALWRCVEGSHASSHSAWWMLSTNYFERGYLEQCHISYITKIFVCTEVTGSPGVIFPCNFWKQFSACRNECWIHGSHMHLLNRRVVCNCSAQGTLREQITALNQYGPVWTCFSCPSWYEKGHKDCGLRSTTPLPGLIAVWSGEGLLCREVWHGYKLI